MAFDTPKGLDEFESLEWASPDFESPVVETCHELRKKASRDLLPEGLRVMISQNIGSADLAPVAIKILFHKPFACDPCRKGDLFDAAATLPKEFWSEHPELTQDVKDVVESCEEALPDIQNSIREFRKGTDQPVDPTGEAPVVHRWLGTKMLFTTNTQPQNRNP